MFLGAYHFAGDRDELLAAYRRLAASFPPEQQDLHVALTTETGLLVLDACPSRAVFDEFSVSPEFHLALAAAGLPAPRVEPLGDVESAVLQRGRAVIRSER